MIVIYILKWPLLTTTTIAINTVLVKDSNAVLWRDTASTLKSKKSLKAELLMPTLAQFDSARGDSDH